MNAGTKEGYMDSLIKSVTVMNEKGEIKKWEKIAEIFLQEFKYPAEKHNNIGRIFIEKNPRPI